MQLTEQTAANSVSPAPLPAQRRQGTPWGGPSGPRWPAWFLLCAGGLFAFSGISNITQSLGDAQALSVADPLFGIPFRDLLLIIGSAELVLAALCLFTGNRGFNLVLIAWLVFSLILYRAGLWSMGWPHPWPYVGGLTSSLNISPNAADIITSGVGIFLLAGSGAVIWLDAATSRAGAFQKMFCPSCGGHIQFAVLDLGRNIPCPHCKKNVALRKQENLRMSCFFCKGHIEFPAHAAGTKMPCPHCKRNITLKELPVE